MRAGSAREVFAVALRLGLTSFGGPVAHVGYQRREFVERRGWVDDGAFGELVALTQTLPGPASSQLSIAVGWLRAGWAGAVASWVGFTLPSAAIMAALGLWIAGAGVPVEGPVAGAIAGLKAVAVAVVAHAVLAMARRLTPDASRLVIAALAGLAVIAVPAPLVQVALIALGAVAGWAFLPGGDAPGEPGGAPASGPTFAPASAPAQRGLHRASRTWSASLALLGAFGATVVGSQLAASITGDPGLGFLAALVRTGALVFGGGHVVLPLLDLGVVAPGWVPEQAFLAGYGAAQAMPGPLFSFAAYLGVVSSAGPGGVAGAAAATAALFLPGGLLVLAAMPILGAIRRRPRLRGALRGVNAVVVGMLGAALVTPVGTGGIASPLAAVVAAVAGVALVSGRVSPLVVVLFSTGVMAVAAA